MNSSHRQLLLITLTGPTASDGSSDRVTHTNVPQDDLGWSRAAERLGLGMQRVASLEEAMTAIEQGTVAMAMLGPASETDVRPVVQPLVQRWPELPLLVWGEDRARPAQVALRAGAWAYVSSTAELEHLDDVLRPAAPDPVGATEVAHEVGAEVAAPSEAAAPTGEDLTLAAAERLAIQRALEASAGNVKRAAKTLGIARATLYRKMARFGLRS